MAQLRVGIDGSAAKTGSDVVARALKSITDSADLTTGNIIDLEASMKRLGEEITRSVRTPSEQQSEALQKVNLLYNKGIITTETYTRATEELEKAWERNAPGAQEQAALLARVQKVIDDTQTPLEELQAATKEYDELLQTGALSQETYTRAIALAQSEYEKATGATQELNSLMQEGQQLTEALRTPQEALSVAMDRYDKLLKAGAIDQTTYNRAVQAAQARIPPVLTGLQGLNASFVNLQSSVGHFLDRFINLKSLLAAGALGVLIHEVASAQEHLDNLSDKFVTASGSADAAAREFTFVSNFAREMGVNFEQSAQNLTTLENATRGTQLEGKATRDIFVAVTEATAVMGSSTQDTAGIFQQFQAMLSRGSVSTRDLVGLFGDKLPGVLQLVAHEFGVTAEQLTHMIARGQVAAEDLLPKLANALHEAFGERAAENSKQLGAQVERLTFQWENLKTSIATLGSDSVKGGAGILEKIIGGLALRFGNALDPADQLDQKIKDLKEHIHDLENSPGTRGILPSKAEIEAAKKELADLEAQQEKLLGVGAAAADKAGDIAARLAAKGQGRKLTEEQITGIEDLSIELEHQSEALRIHAKLGDDSAAALDRLDASTKLASLGVKELTPQLLAQLQVLDRSRKSDANANLVRDLQEQSAQLLAQANAGEEVAKAMDEYAASSRAAKAGIHQLTPEVVASLASINQSRQALTQSNIAKDLREQTAELRVQAEAGPQAALALEKFRLESELAKVGVKGLNKELAQLFADYIKEQGQLEESSIAQQLEQQAHEFDLQAKFGARATEEIRKYELEQQLAAKGVDGLNEKLRERLTLVNQSSDRAALASMEDELHLLQLGNSERSREVALRKLSSDATEEQRQHILQLNAELEIAQANSEAASSIKLDFSQLDSSRQAQLDAVKDLYAQIDDLRQRELISDGDARALRIQASIEEYGVRTQHARQFFGDLSALQHAGNAKLFRIGKAAAIAQAALDGGQAIMNALATPPWYVGAALAIAAAAQVGAQIAQIKSVQYSGFKTGGYTGGTNPNEVMGFVHGKEYVLDAQNTSRLGVGNLDALRAGQARIVANSEAADRVGSRTTGSGGGGSVNVTIANYGTSKSFEVQQLSESDIRIIARDEAEQQVLQKTPKLVAGQLSDPNSTVSKALSRNTQAGRRR